MTSHEVESEECDAEGLIGAVILQAKVDLLSGDREIREEACWWIFFRVDRAPMSFLWCCEVMALDPVKFRETLYHTIPTYINECWQAFQQSDIDIVKAPLLTEAVLEPLAGSAVLPVQGYGAGIAEVAL